MPEKFLGIVVQDSSDSKSNLLHVDIFQSCFIHLRYILYIPVKLLVILLKSWTSTGYSSNPTSSCGTKCQFSSDNDALNVEIQNDVSGI